MKQARKKKKAIGTMTPFYCYDQNPQGFAFLYKSGLLISLGLPNLKKKNMKGKYEKDCDRSSKVTPSCKCVVFVDKSALKNSLVVYKGFLGLLYVLSSTTTPPP